MAMLSENESRQTAYFAAQLENLSARAARSGIVLYSDFLTLSQQQMAAHAAKHAGCQLCLYGGGADSQRKIAAFARDEQLFDTADFPIVIVKAVYDTRFLQEPLNHRDFLGALMHLSIRREMLGDIVVGDGEAYLFVQEKSASCVLRELDRVKRASVTLSVVESCPLSAAPTFTESVVTVSSMRLDCVVTQLMRCGRNTAADAIRQGLIRIGDAAAEKPDRMLKEGDELSIRGHGKYRIGAAASTRKGRLAVTILKYQ